MKNSKWVLSIAVVSLLSLYSCSRCEKCSYTYTDTNGQQITSEVGESCGTTTDLAKLEDDCETASSIVGATCECVPQ